MLKRYFNQDFPKVQLRAGTIKKLLGHCHHFYELTNVFFCAQVIIFICTLDVAVRDKQLISPS